MKKPSDTRDRLVNAAAFLFHHNGYHATGLAKILRVAKTPKGVLYYHFPGGKSELAVAAIKLTADVFKKQLDDAGTAATSAADYVVKIGQLTVDDLVKSKFKAGRPLTTIALETAPDNEALSTACKTGFDL